MLRQALILSSHREYAQSLRSGLLKLTELAARDEQIKMYGTTAVVTLRLELAGTFDDVAFSGDFRYTRVWAQPAGRWQVVSAHVSQVFA